MSESVYDQDFFDYTSSVSRRSSDAVVPVLKTLLGPVNSVVDFGCAQGVWLKSWQDAGVEEICGVDGDYVDTERLFIPADAFSPRDLNAPIDLGRRFDVAHSFEVAEHLRPESAQAFVESLTRHADLVLFSAAPPGQGGEHHINEQPYEYWRAVFAKCGYHAYDPVRGRIKDMDQVAFWYRYNIFLYVKEGCEERLSDAARASRVAGGVPLADVSPFVFKVRKALVRCLPQGVQNALARFKASAAR